MKKRRKVSQKSRTSLRGKTVEMENKENSVLVKGVMGDGDGLNRSYSKCTSYYQVTK